MADGNGWAAVRVTRQMPVAGWRTRPEVSAGAVVKSPGARDTNPDLPRRREPALAGLGAFIVDRDGRVTAWPVTASQLFGRPARTMTGQDICDVLMTGPGQRELVGRALAQVGLGEVFTTTVAGGNLGEGRFAIRWEPLAEGSALVIAQRASSQPLPGWLSEATARIGTTLDLLDTAAEVVDTAVPRFADAAVIYIAERLLAADELGTAATGPGTAVRRLAGRAAGSGAGLTGTLLHPGEVLALGQDMPLAHVMATAEPVLFDQLDSETTERLGRHPGGLDAARRYTSFLAVPLAARGTVIGCALFGRETASPPFHQGDLALASELGSRAAVCIDNARLYQRERRTTLALQQALVASRPQAPAGMEVAHHYLPVGHNVLGGDWHDIITLPDGRVMLIVGDTMGHGPEAAAVMVQLRTAAHTLADLGLPPVQLLARLDRMVTGMATAPYATCVAAIVDPRACTCLVIQAGHMPPVVTLPGREAEVLDLPPGLPLGLGNDTFEATQISLPPGAALALYTDGLVESRNRPLDDGLATLQRVLTATFSQPVSELDDACQAVTRAMREQGEDDITLVLARIRQ